MITRTRARIPVLSITLAVCWAAATTTWAADQPNPPQSDAASIARWQAMRFGMFIHWGPVSLKGTEIGWSRGREIPTAEYDQLYTKFDPVKFDADQWTSVAQDAGMKYVVITTKHHDGFCLWPSKYTDYHIGNSPFQRDVLKELSAACRKQGLAFGTYYSVCDWQHPDFPRGSPGGRTQKPHPDLDRYTQYLRNQVTELIKNYGPLSTMWFDVPQDVGPDRGKPTVALVRSLQPDIVINNRAYRGGGAPVGDYDTPEQRIGGFSRQRPWETCMTICRQWAWKPNDRMKSLKECLQVLIYTAGGDGNLLLNVGPMPDGQIEPRQVARLKEMGQWLAEYGTGIYGTRGGPLMPGKWGASTCKDDTVYLFVIHWPEEGPLVLPAIEKKIVSTKTLTEGKAHVKQTDAGLEVSLPAADRDQIATVIALQLDGAAFELPPRKVAEPPSGSVALGKPASASNVFQKMTAQYGPQLAVDDDPDTRWATDAGTQSAWLEVNLGKPTTIDRAHLREAYPGRVQKFQLQAKLGDTWKTFATGTQVGETRDLKFEPVDVQTVRLNILEATEGPTIWEFRLFGP